MILESLVKQVDDVMRTIQTINRAMHHTTPASVRVLRKTKEELQGVVDSMMSSCVLSNLDLESILAENNCMRDCLKPTYAWRPEVLPKPVWGDKPKPPAEVEPPPSTVSGVNLILYIDATKSMKDMRGKLKTELLSLATYLQDVSNRDNIPCTYSLIWFGDIEVEPYYRIAANKEDVSTLTAKLDAFSYMGSGYRLPESGLLAMKNTINQVHKSGVQNTLIYVTDAASKEERGVTIGGLQSTLGNLGIHAYGIFPSKKTPDIKPMFLDYRDYGHYPLNITEWADKTLRPGGA